MNDKVCENCKWFKERDGWHLKDKCCRYPKWLELECTYGHYCGEFEWKGEYDD